MPIRLDEENGGKVIVIHVSGTLVKADYGGLGSEFERRLQQHGKLRVHFDMTDFHGWDAGAMWEDVKFDLKHFAEIDRLAMVGDAKWEQALTTFWKPFTRATIRYFDHADFAEARNWLGEGSGLLRSSEEEK